jgi:predicted metal-dependent peptidase
VNAKAEVLSPEALVAMEGPARDLVKEAQLALSVWCPFFAHLVLKMKVIITDRIPLAAVTPDRVLLINPQWATTTTPGELAATLVHETLHIALLNFERQGERKLIVQDQHGQKAPLWNLACDFVINEVIEHMSERSPLLTEKRFLPPTKWEPKGLYDAKYDGWSAEEVYDDLLTNVKQPPPDRKGCSPGQGNFIIEMEFGPGTADMQDGDRKADGTKMSPTEKALEKQYWTMALVEAAMVHQQTRERGTLPGRIDKLVKEITEPQVSWREALSRWVGQNGARGDFSYRRPSRRSESAGTILPILVKWGIADVVILWDTSGSMNSRETEIMSEVVGMCHEIGMTVWVITCDTEVHSDQKGVSEADQISVIGGGGSDFCPAFELVEEAQFEGVIVAFTDGYIRVPPVAPVNVKGVLWVLWEHDVDPTGGTWGEILRVQDGKVKR